MKYRLELAGNVYELEVEVRGQLCEVRGPDGRTHQVTLEARTDGQRATTPWGELELVSVRRGTEIWAHAGGRRLFANAARFRPSDLATANAGLGRICAPMAGKLLRLEVRVGDLVKHGQALAVVEAMKMENVLTSPLDGVVTEIAIQAPSALDKGALILEVEPR